MKKEFTPKINRAVFAERVMEEREGNYHIGSLKKLLDGRTESSIYEKFIGACSQKNIRFTAFEDDTRPGVVYTVLLWVNGYESHLMTYTDPDKDITLLLAEKLYGLLIEQFKNEMFFEEHLSEAMKQIYRDK